MAREPPVNGFRPPDENQQRRLEKTNKTHQESPSNSSYSSTNSRNNEAMHIASSERELDGIHKIISQDREKLIHGKLSTGNESTNQELQYTKKSCESIVPFERTDEAISGNFTEKSQELSLQIRPTSHQFHGDLTTGVYSPGREVPLTVILGKMDGPIVGDKNSDERTTGKSKNEGGATRVNYSLEEEVHLTNISSNLHQQYSQEENQADLIDSTAKQQVEFEEPNCRTEAETQGTHSQEHAGPNGQKQDQLSMEHQKMKIKEKHGDTRIGPDQNDHHDNAGDATLEVIEVESSSHFSFGVNHTNTPINTEGQQKSGKTINFTTKTNHVQMQEQQTRTTSSQSKKSTAEDTQTGKYSYDNSSRDAVSLTSSEDQLNATEKGHKTVMLNDHELPRGDNESQQQVDQNQNRGKNKKQDQLPDHGGNSEPNSYHKDFPKISSNYDRPIIPIQKAQQTNQSNLSKEPNITNDNQKTKQDQNAEPAPYTVVQTLAARLRQIHATHATSIELVPPRHTTKQGQPAVIYDMDDFMNKLTVDCKYTLVGKFSNTMPKIELIRKSFILQTQLNGGVNIAHYNARHVFIDLDNELDYNTVWTQQRMTIEGKLMRIQAWTPTFRPEEETPIVPIWVLLPGLPWHCFKKEFITPLLESVGKVLYLDTASIKRTTASMAKVKVQVDLTKARPRHIWIGLDDEDLTIGRWQPIEYENIPPYCTYCKHQGHMIGDCNFKIRDEDFKRRKELGTEMANIHKGEQEQQGNEHRQSRTRDQETQQHQNSKEGSNQQAPEQPKENEWQVPRRRNNKPQEEKIQKAVWRPTSPQNKVPKEHPQLTAQHTGTNNSPNHNSFTNLKVQGKQSEDSQKPNSKEKTTPQGAQNRSKSEPNQRTQTK
ncbi:hypothetical protein KY290_012909 [Solanum tuberosum]|uniref:DUF4283 domain-containing protein n=1 Tax=Solanum tuberosum TaxID=4113 RepID=A0ABQ7VM35_SOLTU|nr:hypothetical protein KY290_012909 [Solanum tuberosum]